MADFSLSGGVRILGYISPFDTNDTYAVIDPLYGVDGLRNVNNLSQLTAITTERRRAGMVVGVDNTTGTTYYTLKNSPWNNTLSDWFETHTVSDNLITFPSTIDAQTYLSGGTNLIDIIKNDGDIVDGQNVGSGTGIFKDKSGTTLNFRTLTGVAPSNKITTAVSGDTVQLDIDEPKMTLWPLVVTGNKLISGNVTFVSGLTFDVSALEYIIGSTVYNASPSQVTLSSGDTTYDRIDVIFADISGNTGVVEGTPTANPSKPNVNTATQVEVTFVTVPAGSSTPDISITKIYDENLGSGGGEWDYSATTAVRISGDSTADAFSGTKSVEFISAATSDSFTMTIPTPYDLSNDNILTFYLKNKDVWNGNQIDISLLDSGDTINGGAVTLQDSVFGFDGSNISAWQIISIDLATFSLSNNLVSKVRFEVNSPTDPLSAYIDLIRFQSGAATVSPQNIWYSIIGDDNNTTDATSPTDQLRLSGGTNIETSVSNKTVTFDITSGISATYIGDGTITNTEYQYLSGATSNIQNQLDSIVDNNGIFDIGNSGNTVPSAFQANVSDTFELNENAKNTGFKISERSVGVVGNVTNDRTYLYSSSIATSAFAGPVVSLSNSARTGGTNTMQILLQNKTTGYGATETIFQNGGIDGSSSKRVHFITHDGDTQNLYFNKQSYNGAVHGDVIVQNGNFAIKNLGTGTSVNTLGIDSNGYVVSADTNSNDYVSGGTFNDNTKLLSFSGTNTATTFNISLSALSTDNYFVTGYTYEPTGNTFTINLNNGSAYTATITSVSGLTTPSGGTIDAGTLKGNTITSGGTNLNEIFTQNAFTTFSSTTLGQTSVVASDVNEQINFSGININILTNNAGKTITFSADTEVGEVNTGLNVGTGTNIFKDKTGTTLNFRTLKSTGSTVDITTIDSGNTINLEVTHTVDTNTFINSYTYEPSANTFTITRNDGTAFTSTFTTVSGLTVSNDITVDGNALVKGDVTILGTATTINTETLTIEDNIITLNSTATGTTEPLLDSGIDVLRNSATTASLLWDETNDYWTAGLSGSTARIILQGDSLSLLDSGHTHTVSEITDLKTFTTFSSTTLGETSVITDNVNDQINFSGININILTDNTTKTLTFSADTESLNTDNYTTGGTYNTGTTSIDFSGTNLATTFSVNVSALLDDTNTFVTGGTFSSGGTLTLDRNNNTSADPIDFTTTKRLVISSDQALAISAGRSYLLNTGASLLSFNNSPASVDEEASFNFSVPTDYVSGGQFFIKMATLASTPPNNEIQFEMNITSIDLGGDLSSATDTAISGITSASTTSWEIVESPSYVPVSSTFSADKHVAVKINRDVSDTPDTYNGTAYVWGLVFEYTGIR